MLLVITLTVRRDALDTFRSFERFAARVMSKYGGRIERAIVLLDDASTEVHRELHIVSFPDEERFAAYQRDSELVPLAELRAAAVLATEVRRGEPGPDYDVLS